MPPLPFCWTTIAARFVASSWRIAHSEVGLSPFRRALGWLERQLISMWVLLLRSYRVLLSPLFAGSCRFEPSCSHYAEEAVRRHGSVRGLWLTVRRLGRCHPFNAGGYDPVPDCSRWRVSSEARRRVEVAAAHGQHTSGSGELPTVLDHGSGWHSTDPWGRQRRPNAAGLSPRTKSASQPGHVIVRRGT